jgi:membrane protein
MILGLGFLLLVSLIISTILARLGDQVTEYIGMDQAVARGTNLVLQAAVAFVIFGAIFKFMPDARIRWRDVAVGAALTTVLFLLGRYAMEWYLAASDPGAKLGSAAAALAVILIWVYYSSMIFLLGAEATQAYAVQYGSGIIPQPNAVRVIESVQRPNATRG